jgi:hypothetical protein
MKYIICGEHAVLKELVQVALIHVD